MQTLYDEAIPSFNVMGKKSFFLGPVGNGAKMKLVVNMIMGRYFLLMYSIALTKMRGSALYKNSQIFKM